MPDKEIDDMIENEIQRRKRIAKKLELFTNQSKVKKEVRDIPEAEWEKEVETPLADFVNNWKEGARTIIRKGRGK